MFAGSRRHLDRARRTIPRGVSSARRAALPPVPLAFARAAGSRITDVDGNEYIDYVAGYGPMLLGHQAAPVTEAVRAQLSAGVLYGGQHEAEAELAERIIRLVPSAEMALLGVTGSEADQMALRLARAATGRRSIVKFEGHYHGWLDPMTANTPGSPPGSGPAPRAVSVAAHSIVGPEVLICPWNDAEALADLLAARGSEIAAVIMEPVAVNGGMFYAAEGYLTQVRELCDRYGCMLVFDEVVTGFRLAAGGAQELLGVTPDLTVLGKALGSGFPISAVAGRKSVMRVAEGPMAHAGTYNGNCLSVAAANATLQILESTQDTLYARLERRSAELTDGVEAYAAKHGMPLQAARAGSIIRLHWDAPDRVRSYANVLAGQTEPLRVLTERMVRSGIHVRENGLWYVSAAHTEADVRQTLTALDDALRAMAA